MDLRTAVKRDLRRKRRVPSELRWTMLAAAVALAAWGAAIVLAFVAGFGGDALRMGGLMLASGREPAMLAAYESAHPMPLWLVALVGATQDAATVLASLCALAFTLRRLRHLRWVDRLVSGVEREAMKRREWVRKWGLWGVVGFYFLPGFGSGAVAAGLLGLLAGLSLRRLAIGLPLGGVAVCLFWAVALRLASSLLPSGPWAQWLPVAVLGALLAVSAVNAWRHRGQPKTLVLDWDVAPRAADKARLEKAGLHVRDSVVEVDVARFSRASGIPAKHTPTLRSAAKLMLVHGMDVEAARRLAQHGVTGIRDLALLDPELMREVVEGAPRSWRVSAQGMARRHPV